jgi:phage gpG-like protein
VADLSSDILRIVGRLAVRQIQRRIRQRRVTPHTRKPGVTLVERGLLTQSIKAEPKGNKVVISAGGANVPYARIHHEGGVIRPKTAKYLAIPLTPKAKQFRPRQYPGETFIKKGVIFGKDGEKLTPLYALKKQVTIPARPYMLLDGPDRKVIEAAVAERIQRDVDAATAETRRK